MPPAFKTVPFQDEHFELKSRYYSRPQPGKRPSQKRYDPSFTTDQFQVHNILVIDNHSTDTTPLLIKMAQKHSQIIHIIPSHRPRHRGCWTHAIMSEHCGRFAIQLDSDDLYINRHVLQRIVDTFHKHQCAMIIGSYKMVNFKLEEIPPGIIDQGMDSTMGVTTPYVSMASAPSIWARHYSGKSESRQLRGL